LDRACSHSHAKEGKHARTKTSEKKETTTTIEKKTEAACVIDDRTGSSHVFSLSLKEIEGRTTAMTATQQ